MTFSSTKQHFQRRRYQKEVGELTNSTSFCQIFSKCTLPIDVEIVAHEPSITEKTKPPTFLPSSENLMAIIPNLGVFDTFFVILPEPLYTPSALVLVTHIVTPRALNPGRHVVPISIPHSFQGEKLNLDNGWMRPIKS